MHTRELECYKHNCKKNRSGVFSLFTLLTSAFTPTVRVFYGWCKSTKNLFRIVDCLGFLVKDFFFFEKPFVRQSSLSSHNS
ncbi:hypothetical protein HanXRQr2_Chr13g0610071 [Helianthus annuus]|uniref:Uncharacterized protein n=1 Tax=Helianthus annuus TaxID=4232 RepID=A0A9K3ELL0_HELAN|nr:hypothetical protein HanXRQr2_Chr13g0610071 [Helianthus annuus]